MRRIVLTCSLMAVMLLITVRSSAQYYFYNDSYYDTPLMFEVGVSAGAMNCLTDIGGNKGIGAKFTKDLNIGRTEFTGGAYMALMYKYTVGLRFEANFGRISAYDSVLSDVPRTDIARARYNRNLIN